MKVRCERDDTVFEAEPRPYPCPGGEFQTTHHRSEGDMQIVCPTCFRGYLQEEDGTFVSDRPLTILES